MTKFSKSFHHWLTELAINIVDGIYIPVSAMMTGLVMSQWGHVSVCRQTPSCRVYTYQAMRTRGIIHGLLAGIRRMIHCRSIH